MNMHYRSKHAFACCLVLVLAIQTFTIAAQDSSPSESISIKNFGKVNDNYYRGSQPTAKQYKDLRHLGVKTIIDLRKDRLKEASDWARAAGLEY